MAYIQSEEDRLEAILQKLDYEIDEADTLSLILGRT
jgi:hypothetical protein